MAWIRAILYFLSTPTLASWLGRSLQLLHLCGILVGFLVGLRRFIKRHLSVRRCRKFSIILLLVPFILAHDGVAPATSSPLYLNDAYDELFQVYTAKWWLNRPDWKWLKAQAYQESALKPAATSYVGAAGLLQFMPDTWAEESRLLRIPGASPHDVGPAIELGAHYMMRLRQQWSADRPVLEKHRLAQASYNAGLGSVLKAQALCAGARLWNAIAPCLERVTGPDNARQTIDYVDKIAAWRRLMGE